MNNLAQKPDWLTRYKALRSHVGLVDLGKRTQIEIAGPDRASFLHNLCTNEIRKLAIGAGCEAFLTTVQGKTLAHVLVFAGPDALVLETVPGEAEKILAHLDHYLVCEQVTLIDRTAQWSELLLAGPESESLLEAMAAVHVPQTRLAHAPASLAGASVWLRRVDLTGSIGFLIGLRDEDISNVTTALDTAGAVACPMGAFQAARIERGFPLFGTDISDKNLPQEVARDAQAISFVKGCYLGQETVARIDALGHVNKTLVGLKFASSEIPAAGMELLADGQPAGHVTSATFSPRLGLPLALGYVRRSANTPGTRLSSTIGEAEVVDLPVD